MVVAEVLGVGLERIRVVAGDSALTPKDNGAYSSRITYMVGNAAIDAANNLKKVLIEAAAKKLDAKLARTMEPRAATPGRRNEPHL